jgi:hypothetical protein
MVGGVPTQVNEGPAVGDVSKGCCRDIVVTRSDRVVKRNPRRRNTVQKPLFVALVVLGAFCLAASPWLGGQVEDSRVRSTPHDLSAQVTVFANCSVALKFLPDEVIRLRRTLFPHWRRCAGLWENLPAAPVSTVETIKPPLHSGRGFRPLHSTRK